jgi:hypothetical protein
MDRMPMTDDEIARCEQYTADEDAERMYQEMQAANQERAEAWYAAEDAERAYEQMIQD